MPRTEGVLGFGVGVTPRARARAGVLWEGPDLGGTGPGSVRVSNLL